HVGPRSRARPAQRDGWADERADMRTRSRPGWSERFPRPRVRGPPVGRQPSVYWKRDARSADAGPLPLTVTQRANSWARGGQARGCAFGSIWLTSARLGSLLAGRSHIFARFLNGAQRIAIFRRNGRGELFGEQIALWTMSNLSTSTANRKGSRQ